MRATIKAVLSSDVELGGFIPVDERDVDIHLRLIIGPDDGPGEESFGVTVCTPRALERLLSEVRQPVIGRHSCSSSDGIPSASSAGCQLSLPRTRRPRGTN